jgi:sugar lactone lactonase YvrE
MKRPLLFAVFFASSVFLLITGCKKTTTSHNAPALATQDLMLDVTATSAQSGGTITAIGDAVISENGVCYSTTNTKPTIADIKVTAPLITVSYTFACNITGLTPSTTYYLRAYATNEYGTAYGDVVKFTTPSNVAAVSGTVTTIAGSGTGGYADGNGTGAEFNNPGGIAVDAQGNIYVADSFNNRIRKMATDGTVTTIAGNGTPGYLDGPAANAEFYNPQSLVVDPQGNIFVADYGNNVIREISASGVVSTFAGNTRPGYENGTGSSSEFNAPYGIALDKSGNFYVSDYNNNMIRKITSQGVVTRIAGYRTAGYANTTVDIPDSVFGAFHNPAGIAVDGTGNIYVADLGNSAIRQITPGGVITTIGGGPGQVGLIGYPAGLSIDAQGNLFIADESGRIIELTAARTLYVLSGTSGISGFADGSGPAAQFNTPIGTAVDNAGNIYVADFNNNRIRKVVITTTE